MLMKNTDRVKLIYLEVRVMIIMLKCWVALEGIKQLILNLKDKIRERA